MITPQTVPDLFQHTRETWLENARETAYELLQKRYIITIEDVLKECPRPTYLHRNIVGAVFRDSRFQAIGFTLSTRAAFHGSVIRQWTLKKEYLEPKETDRSV